MKAKVNEKGVMIPKSLLEGVSEVEIIKENSQILVVPTMKEDPIFQIGKHPVVCNLPDASEKHDDYIYGFQE